MAPAECARVDSPADLKSSLPGGYRPWTARPLSDRRGGRAVHFGGRNRLLLDGHVEWLRDVPTNESFILRRRMPGSNRLKRPLRNGAVA